MLLASVWFVCTLLAVGNSEKIKGDEADDENKVCFKALGCFSVEEPWKTLLRPIPAPMSPEKINTRIYFYSRPDIQRRHEILLKPKIKLNGADFNRTKPTIIITHGFAANGNSTWMEKMKNAILRRVDANVMLTDWGNGSSLLNYLQVSGNTRVVGKELARLIKELHIDPGNLHLIGHSLGSHISAYAAKETPGVARITALDPAQPAFEGFDPKVRLDESDAKFVDVLHTDARPFIPTLGFGMISSVGHVDFYLNGGFEQPGCLIPDISKLPKISSLADLALFPVEVISDIVTCPHGRAYEYFTESIEDMETCIFWGHQTSLPSIIKTVANTVTQGFVSKLTALSTSCSKTDCTPMGLRTKLSHLRGSFVVTTNRGEPYCVSEKGIPPETASGPIKNDTILTKLTKNVFVQFQKLLGQTSAAATASYGLLRRLIR